MTDADFRRPSDSGRVGDSGGTGESGRPADSGRSANSARSANLGQPQSFGRAPSRAVDTPTTVNPVVPSSVSASRAEEPSVGAKVADKAKGLFGSAKSAVSSAATSVSSAVSSDPDSARSKEGLPTVKATSGTTTAGKAAARRTRRARLRVARIDPWSVMKTSFLFGFAAGIIFFICVWMLWGVVGVSGVFDSVNRAVNDLVSTPGADAKFHLEDYLNTRKVLGLTAIIAAADVVIFTALATLFSFLYNLSSTVMGGIEVTLAED